MHIHILGICGTFMAGLALLAREQGHRVSGSDANAYPPMSTQLEAQGIEVRAGYDPAHLEPAPDVVVIGNALSRGNPMVEAVLDRGLAYTSGPQWLSDFVLRDRWVLAVAGTHGKTTTSSMLAWILEEAGLAPGFLIGGIPQNFGVSARLGETPFFVVEADEYDTAFFDKRSKFVHYRPRTAVLNNLEFDHADIFADLEAIKRQFHHLVRTVPSNGLIISEAGSAALEDVLQRGCWTPVERFGAGPEAEWRVAETAGGGIEISQGGQCLASVDWSLMGRHNMHNALGAVLAARHAGVPVPDATAALGTFRSVKRRMELRAVVNDVAVYDDFAHHPTAVRTTLEGLRGRVGGGRILAVLEPRSNTMRMGVHRTELAPALADADEVYLFDPPGLGWDLSEVGAELGGRGRLFARTDELIDALLAAVAPGDHVLIMSNGSFEGLHERFIAALRADDARASAGGNAS